MPIKVNFLYLPHFIVSVAVLTNYKIPHEFNFILLGKQYGQCQDDAIMQCLKVMWCSKFLVYILESNIFSKCMDKIHYNRGWSVFTRWKWSISDCDNEFCHVSLLIYCLSFIGMCIFTYIVYSLFVYLFWYACWVVQVVKSICKPIKSLW